MSFHYTSTAVSSNSGSVASSLTDEENVFDEESPVDVANDRSPQAGQQYSNHYEYHHPPTGIDHDHANVTVSDENSFGDSPNGDGFQLVRTQPPPSPSATAPPTTHQRPNDSSASNQRDDNIFEASPETIKSTLESLPPPPTEAAPPASAPLTAASAASAILNRLVLDPDSWANMFWATASNQQRLQQFMYSRSLLLSVITQVTLLILFAIIEPSAIKKDVPFSPVMAFFLVLAQVTQLAIIVLAHIGMARELQALYVRPGKIWNMYCSVVLSFSALYFTFFCFQRSSFQVDGYAPDARDDVDYTDPDDTPYEDLKTSNDITTVFIYFCYFSGAIMTSTGFGDIAPTLWYSQASTNAQMLIGTMYHVGVFGLTLSHFRTFQKVSAAQEAADLAAGRISRVMRCWRRFTAIPWVHRWRNHPRTNQFKKFCIKYLALVSVIFQTLNTCLLLAIPDPFRPLTPKDPGYNSKVVVLTFITIFQTGMFIGVMYVSIRLVKKINNADITAGFLIQSFLATALLFGGIYFVLFAATPSHQFSRHTAFDLSVFEVLYVFVHFSFTVMTTTGFGDVYARGVIARLFVLTQMLISILYSAVIIGLGTSQLIDMQAAEAESSHKKQEDVLRRSIAPDAEIDEINSKPEENPFDSPLEERV